MISSFNTEVTNVIFDIKDGKKVATAIECKVKGVEKGIVLTENDLVFVTNGSCTEGTIYGDQNHAPNGDAEVRTQRLLEFVEKHCKTGSVLWTSGEVLL